MERKRGSGSDSDSDTETKCAKKADEMSSADDTDDTADDDDFGAVSSAMLRQACAHLKALNENRDPNALTLLSFQCSHATEFSLDAIEGEYTLGQTELHKRYCKLYEKALEAFLKPRNLTTHEFAAAVRDGLAGDCQQGGRWARQLLDLTLRATDFQIFSRCMVSRHQGLHDAGIGPSFKKKKKKKKKIKPTKAATSQKVLIFHDEAKGVAPGADTEDGGAPGGPKGE